MSNHLEPYQETFVQNIIETLEGNNSIIAQLSTGGGKTIVFASIVDDYIKHTYKDVLIVVHRIELLNQTRNTLFKWYNIGSEKIDVDNKNITKSRVYVAMVETLKNRIKDKRVFNLMQNVGLAVIDEAHMSNFKKIFPHFPNSKIIGFTATPIAATKKDPLRNYYDDIVVGCSISSLIDLNQIKKNRGLARNLTYSISNINRGNLKIRGDEFDEEDMAKAFSNRKQVQNTIEAYVKYSFRNHKKAICFNTNVAHSKLVTEEMCKAGLNARHLDGSHDDAYRTECFRWLKNTPDAILCNVGIATTGFDEPSIETVIVNSAMKSLSYWLQKCGRGARPHEYPDGAIKENFLILDLGGNALAHGDWCEERDWRDIFINPHIPRDGKPPLKACPECSYINAAAAKTCKQCNFEFPIKSAEEDNVQRELVLITTGVNVKQIIEQFKNRDEYDSFCEIIKKIASIARNTISVDNLDEDELQKWHEITREKIIEWIAIKGKKAGESYLINAKYKLIRELHIVGFIFYTEKNYLVHNNEKIEIPGFENYLFDTKGEIIDKDTQRTIKYVNGYATISNNDGIAMEFSHRDIEHYISQKKFSEMEYEESKEQIFKGYSQGLLHNHIQVQQLINTEKKMWDSKLYELEENAKLAWAQTRHGKRETAAEYALQARDLEDAIIQHKESPFGEIHAFILNEAKEIQQQIQTLKNKSDYINRILSYKEQIGNNHIKKTTDQSSHKVTKPKTFENNKSIKNVRRFNGKLNAKAIDTENVISLLKKGITGESAMIKAIYGDSFDIGGGKEFSSETGENPRHQIHTIRENLSKKIGVHLEELNQKNALRL